jgi:hypothetical protein
VQPNSGLLLKRISAVLQSSSMQLDHPDLEPFEPIVIRLWRLQSSGGVKVLRELGIPRVEGPWGSEGDRRRFIRGCHYGWDRAQKEIARRVIELESQIIEARSELKELRRRRDSRSDWVLKRMNVCVARQSVLRRIMDTILHTMLCRDRWVLRRLMSDEGVLRTEPRILQKTVEIATERNSENRLRFSLVADLASSVLVGDLIEIDLTQPAKRPWTILELKEGRVNELLSGVLGKAGWKPCDEELQKIAELYGPRVAKQATRMIRQQNRRNEFKKIVEGDQGIDPQSGMFIQLAPEVVPVDDYRQALHLLWKKATESGAGGVTIDGCLRLLAVREDVMRGDYGAVMHALYHMAAGGPCRLKDAGGANEELTRMRSIPPIVDLIDQNIRSGWAPPVFVWVEEQEVLDYLFGRVRAFAQFDYGRFFDIAAKRGIKMSWMTGKDAESIKKLSMRIPGSPDAWGVRAEMPDGTTQHLLSGFFGRVFADYTLPHELFALMTVPEPAAASGTAPQPGRS